MLLLLCNCVVTTTTKWYMKHKNKNKKINLHTFSVQWYITQSFCCCCSCCYSVMLLQQQNYTLEMPRAVLHQVSLTFTVRCKVGLICTVRHTKVRCTPHYRYLVAKSNTMSGQLDMSAWHLQSDIPRSDVPPLEASGGQEQYYIRSAWHLQSDVRSTWHVQSDIPRSDVPPTTGIWWLKPVLHKVSLTCLVRHTQVRCPPQ